MVGKTENCKGSAETWLTFRLTIDEGCIYQELTLAVDYLYMGVIMGNSLTLALLRLTA